MPIFSSTTAQFATFPLHGIPNSISEHMSFDYTTGAYYPILYREEFWLLPQHHVVINNATHDFIVDEVGLPTHTCILTCFCTSGITNTGRIVFDLSAFLCLLELFLLLPRCRCP